LKFKVAHYPEWVVGQFEFIFAVSKIKEDELALTISLIILQ